MALLYGIECTAEAPDLMCKARRAALRDGSMFWSRVHHGWIFPSPTPMQKMDLVEPREPIVWREWCPFCNGPLPDEQGTPVPWSDDDE